MEALSSLISREQQQQQQQQQQRNNDHDDDDDDSRSSGGVASTAARQAPSGRQDGGNDAALPADVEDLPAGAAPYEDFDFMPYFEDIKSEEELRKSWRVFTKVKDVLENGRRLENASWRLWFAKRAQGETLQEDEVASELSQLQRYDADFQRDLQKLTRTAEGRAGRMFSAGERKREEERDRRERASLQKPQLERLTRVREQHALSSEAMDDVLSTMSEMLKEIMPEDPSVQERVALVPSSAAQLDQTVERVRAEAARMPSCATFGHSLERNGANNFLLYLARELCDDFRFTLMTPKDGPMREDFEALGCTIETIDSTDDSYMEQVRHFVQRHTFLIANTIMRAEAIIAAQEVRKPSLWVIHEAWPQDQFDYYAKEVFQMSHVDGDLIRRGFAAASRIVFPARVQRRCYEGLFEQHRAEVVYNGIPLSSINSFRGSQDRRQVRADLGYTDDDLVVVHLGTICKRKGQLFTARAFSKLKNDADVLHSSGGQRAKLLMVGARYIRQHEIDYQEEIKRELDSSGSASDAHIMEIQKNVLPYYLAGDIIVVPSLNEVLPLVICEAMAFERPVVASRIDGIPEALTDGEEGYLVEPSDADALYDKLKTLALDAKLRERMGRKGRKRVTSQFSFRTMADNYREVVAGARAEMGENGDADGGTGDGAAKGGAYARVKGIDSVTV